jgi:hypothetical protein
MDEIYSGDFKLFIGCNDPYIFLPSAAFPMNLSDPITP